MGERDSKKGWSYFALRKQNDTWSQNVTHVVSGRLRLPIRWSSVEKTSFSKPVRFSSILLNINCTCLHQQLSTAERYKEPQKHVNKHYATNNSPFHRSQYHPVTDGTCQYRWYQRPQQTAVCRSRWCTWSWLVSVLFLFITEFSRTLL